MVDDEKKKEEEKAGKLVVTDNISLKLNDYNDIFSDFDPRPYSQRAVSVDFLDEAKRATRDKEEGLELWLLIPASARNLKEEVVIRKRLREHFKRHQGIVSKEFKSVLHKGIGFVITGIILMFTATLILFKYAEKNFLMTFLVVLLEPGGWFLFWEGWNLVIFESKKKVPDLSFYEKMAKADIVFISY